MISQKAIIVFFLFFRCKSQPGKEKLFSSGKKPCLALDFLR